MFFLFCDSLLLRTDFAYRCSTLRLRRPHFAEVGTVKPESKSETIEKNRLASQCRRARPARGLVNIQGIVTVDIAGRKAERLRVRDQRAGLSYLRPDRRHFPPVVFANKNQRQPPHSRYMHCLVNIA